MSNETAKVDFQGRLQKFKLPKQHALLPLFEAIVNSVQAIAIAQPRRHGSIKITIRRDTTQSRLFDHEGEPGANYLYPITDFEIEDNGIGFTDPNYESFVTLDSRQKQEIGGRGIGRLSWLKAFDHAEIVSVFPDSLGHVKERRITFINSEKPFQNVGCIAVPDRPCVTTVALRGFRAEYRDSAPKSVLAIAEKIIEHGLSYLLQPDAPSIAIADPDEQQVLFDVNEHLSRIATVKAESLRFTIGEHVFEVEVVELRSRAKNNVVHICANRRTVVREPLEKYFPELPEISGKLPTVDGASSLVLRIHSPLLDQSVGDERHTIAITDGSSDLLHISIEDIMKGAVMRFKGTMDEIVKEVELKRRERVSTFIRSNAPKYLPLLKYAPDKLSAMSVNLNDRELDIELHKVFQDEEINLKVEGQKFFGDELISDDPEFRSSFDAYIKKVTEFNSARLAEYVVHRKTVIDMLDQALKPDARGKLSLEDHLHGLFYPMRATSAEVHWRHQNLWLLDERLSFHDLLASDVPLKAIQDAGAESTKEPDIVVFNKPSAYAESESPFQSVVIIEFKRPERKAYNIDGAEDQDEPFAQVYTYIDDIKARRVRDVSGGLVEIEPNARFFCYIIADMTDKMRSLIKRKGEMRPTADGLGYYGYNPEYNVYFEVISYRKVIKDSRMRNRVLFDRLGLPH